ncbi:MAG: hypothetical protein P3X22_007920 [Thermoprotei archaeon]|nr:hypothetical protein [Thermoprotei archaeon]
MARTRRGQAEIIGGLIVIFIVMIIMIPLMLRVISDVQAAAERQKSLGAVQADRLAEKVIVHWLPSLDLRYPAFWLNNTGTVAVTLKTLYFIDARQGTLIYMVNLTEYEPEEDEIIRDIVKYPGGYTIRKQAIKLNPGEGALVYLNPDFDVDYRRVSVAALSERGVIHPVTGRGGSLEDLVMRAVRAVAVEQYVVSLSFTSEESLTNNPNISLKDDYFSSSAERGVVSYGFSGQKTLYYNYVPDSCKWCAGSQINIVNTPFRTLIIGYKPGDKGKFNMLITLEYGGEYYRVKISGLSATLFVMTYGSTVINKVEDAIGYWYYGNSQVKASLTLVGSYENIEVYRRAGSLTPTLSSYAPFILLADTDGNGVGELILVTEDYAPGTYNPPQVQCSADEGDSYLDYSGVRKTLGIEVDREWGFAFKLNNPQINPAIASSVVVSLKVYFHDTEMGGMLCVSNPYSGILRIMLVDSNWNIVSSREYLYFELATYKSTWPPNKGFTTITTQLFIPPGTKGPLYVAIAITDPYSGRKKDDLDITIAIETIGITLYTS